MFFWLGTDDIGRDILSRLIWGAQRVFIWAGLATISAYVTGMLMGVAAGYLGGWWDDVLCFIGNLVMSFPLIVLYLVIIGTLGATPLNIIMAVTLATGPQVMRIVRGIVLDLKTRDYIAAAQVRGERPLYIMLVELLPNARGPLIVDACLRMGYVTITIALLGYLGLGLPPPDPDWGSMINAAQKFGSFGANAMLWPAAAISSMVLGLNMLADGLQRNLAEGLSNAHGPARFRRPRPRVQGPLHQLLHAARRGAGGGRFQSHRHARRSGRPGRRIGLRQVHGGARHHAPHGQERRHHRRLDQVHGPRHHHPFGGGAAKHPRLADRHGLSGADGLAQSVDAGGRPALRSAGDPRGHQRQGRPPARPWSSCPRCGCPIRNES